MHKKLDRLLFNDSWVSGFQSHSLELLSKATSDHCPILYKVDFQLSSTPRSFKFQHMWLRRPDFLELVRSNWILPMTSFGMFRFSQKLKRLKAALRLWNRDHFGNVHTNIKRAEEDLRARELSFEQSGSDADLLSLNRAQAVFIRSQTEEKAFWRQKARLRWLDEGDRNTRFFHSSVVLKRTRLSISRIKLSDSTWTDNPQAIRNEATIFFHNLLAPQLPVLDASHAEYLLDFIPTILSDDDNQSLLRPINLEEVREAIFC